MKTWEEFEFLPGAIEALRLLKNGGYRLIVVTNQRGISLGKLCEDDLKAIHQRMIATLEQSGAAPDAIYYCPHDRGSCDCRKPAIGLFLMAQRDFSDIQFPESYMVGDSAADMKAGDRLACRNILIGSDAATVSLLERENIRIDFFAPSLLDAVRQYILTPGRREQAR